MELTEPGRRFAVRGRVAVDGRLAPGTVVVEGTEIKAVLGGEVRDGDLPAGDPRGALSWLPASSTCR